MVLPLIVGGLASVLVSELPDIAKWMFGDKTGKAVETVTGIARDVFGTDDPADLEAAIAKDPARALQFKMAVMQAEADARNAELQARADERRAELETFRAQVLDVQNARAQTVDLAKAGSPLSWSAAIVSILAVASFLGLLIAIFVFKGAIGPELKDVFLLLIGATISGYNQVLNYYLGSSSGSASKDTALRAAAVGKP